MKRPWSSAELAALRYLAGRLSGPDLAAAFGRSPGAIRQQAARLGVSLRRRENDETLLRLPAGETIANRVRELTQAALCPACGVRFISVHATGLCGACHYHHLRIAQEEEIAKAEAALAYAAAKSKLYRRRRKLAVMSLGAESGDAPEKLDV